MPKRGFATKTLFEAVKKRIGKRNFGKKNKDLLVLLNGFGHSLEVHFGFSRPRHTVQQGHLVTTVPHTGA